MKTKSREPGFSRRFPEEYAAFARGITGLPAAERSDGASVLLHRLMFLYFLQANGWLDGDPKYLKRFQVDGKISYYRRFLRPLLQDGLAKPPAERRRNWGRVPYLGASLFRDRWAGIDVADSAFQRLFAFFDEYQWLLSPANIDGPAVRPEGLGTLFEKHVNRKETGTYYTPADVTNYVTENTILPALIDAAFLLGSEPWQLLPRDPDRYIRDAVRHGVDEPLPRAVILGNRQDGKAPARFGLPTEGWREYHARRERCRRLRKLLAAGAITSAYELVTHNLDLRRFVLDGIAADSRSRRAVLAALEKLTVLDPTCGSGAFLFTALNLLESVWAACLQTPSRTVFSIRAAILRQNLHGVDLREEAIELCRLRLLLRLLAVGKPGDARALPDLGTNLHAGDILDEFPGKVPAGGFHVVIGNPPYVAADRAAKVEKLVTKVCPDVYAWVLERSAALLCDGGRTGMVVPLSLAFSEDFASCRRLLFATYGTNWFSSFARIPSALFAGDVRVRNTIHLGHKTREPGPQYSTRLHRWFEAARPQLFPTLEYTAFCPECWGGRVPRLGSPALLEALARAPGRLGDVLSPRPTPFPPYFKKTAYNWLTFCRQLPPCFAADGSPIAQTQFDVLHFADAVRRDLAFLLLNGKWAFAYWCAAGDDSHVPRWLVSDLPADLSSLSDSTVHRLRPLVGSLERAMFRAVSFRRNAGKRVGTYNLARCRRVTDRSDRVFAEAFEWQYAWDDLQLLLRQVVKTEWEE